MEIKFGFFVFETQRDKARKKHAKARKVISLTEHLNINFDISSRQYIYTIIESMHVDLKTNHKI